MKLDCIIAVAFSFTLPAIANISTAPGERALERLPAMRSAGGWSAEEKAALTNKPSVTLGQAIQFCLQAAEAGDPKAQFVAGNIYVEGYGVPRNDAEGAQWFARAAKAGHAGAQNALGLLHEDGRGVSSNLVEALSWYRKAAEQGLAAAQY